MSSLYHESSKPTSQQAQDIARQPHCGPSATRKPEFDMRVLLERAGACIRSATRADCIHCQGRSHGTVSFTSEVAHCFRCQWSANQITLARELGLLTSDPATWARLRAQLEERARLERRIAAFDRWREAQIRAVSNCYYILSRWAVLAHQALGRTPESLGDALRRELAWTLLADFYHEEAELSRRFDFLACAKASNWLESDSTIHELFEDWRQTHRA